MNIENLLKVVLAILLFGCLVNMPYGYYQLVRYAAMIGFAYVAFESNKSGHTKTTFIFIGLAILFQPFIKISRGRLI